MDLPELVGEQIESSHRVGKDMMHNSIDKAESDAGAVEAERSGRTNAARDGATGRGPMPGRWDSIGEGGEGLDELQGLYSPDASARDHLPEGGSEQESATIGAPSESATTITPMLWDRLMALNGETIDTPKGEPFAVKDVSRGEHVTVTPLDGGQEWVVSAQELEKAWAVVSGGARLDGIASIRLQEAGLGSAHPEYVAGLVHAVTGDQES